MNAVGPPTPPDSPNGVAIQVADGSRAVVAAVRALDAAAIDVEGLTVREPTLDDVFLELTGHTAETSVDAGDPS